MGFGGGPSSLCEDPIVPTNCVEASRTAVCGVEAVGSRGDMLSGPGGITELPWQRPNPCIWVTEDAERDLGAFSCWEGRVFGGHESPGFFIITVSC